LKLLLAGLFIPDLVEGGQTDFLCVSRQEAADRFRKICQIVIGHFYPLSFANPPATSDPTTSVYALQIFSE
jgi:hypothetical protein